MWDIISSSSKGRMGVATQDITVGSLVHIEQPTAFVPYDKTQPFVSSHDAYSLVEESMLSAAFSATGANFRGFSVILAARVISCVRHDQSTAAKVKALCRNTSHHCLQSNLNKYASAQIVKRLLSGTFTASSISLNDCFEVLEKLESNAFTVVDHDMSSVAGIGLYTVAAAINHSCDPNCYQTFDLYSGATLSIRASRDIKKGEEICIAYIDIGKSTSMRRRELSSLYGFHCSCRRCCSISAGGYLCSSLNCGGVYEVMQSDLFLWWKGYTGQSERTAIVNTPNTKSEKTLNSNRDISLLLPTPFDNDTSSNHCIKKNCMRFQCPVCCEIVGYESIMQKVYSVNDRISEMETNRRLGQSSTNQCKQCIAVLLLFEISPYYVIVELYRNFILEDLIIQKKFDMYVQIVRESKYLSYLSQCYPFNHPFPAIQKAMYSKCLLQVHRTKEDLEEARSHTREALQILRVTHGEGSSVVRELESALIDFSTFSS